MVVASMLLLLFNIGKGRYALDASEIVEIVPSVSIERIPRSPNYVAGLICYRNKVVPVVDISELTIGRPCAPFLSTRIVIINYNYEANHTRILGLKGENITEIIERPKNDFVDSGVKNDDAPFLGKVVYDTLGMIQLVNIEELLSVPIRDKIFSYSYI